MTDMANALLSWWYLLRECLMYSCLIQLKLTLRWNNQTVTSWNLSRDSCTPPRSRLNVLRSFLGRSQGLYVAITKDWSGGPAITGANDSPGLCSAWGANARLGRTLGSGSVWNWDLPDLVPSPALPRCWLPNPVNCCVVALLVLLPRQQLLPQRQWPWCLYDCAW